MFDYASSTAAINSALLGIGALIAIVVAAVVAAWGALVGLGFAKRKVTKHVTGKKF